VTKPIVSILTTVYNREKYLADCIASVLVSTYQNWELIIVDDQSTDASVAIAQSYASKDDRIKIYVNEQNLGDYPNRNKAASYAKGKYLKYLDADDLIYPHGLQIMVETMEAYPDCALGISQQVAEDVQPYPFEMSPEETFKREFLQRGVLGLGPTGTIIKRQAFEEFGGFTGTRYIGDTEMWYKLAMKYPVVKMVPGLIYWRQHDDQQIQMEKLDPSILGVRYNHQIETLKQPDLPLSDDDIRLAVFKIMNRFSKSITKLYFQGKVRTAIRIQKACHFNWIMLLRNLI
jgi:glycosyltransferase involved in cell wall biosynthesis